ncbi:MAG: response regulator transcription factor [Planctomycetes bacterium]|nr:response regulator transcription factor [Planctomycetota bacterium]
MTRGRILVVEDDPAILAGLEARLRAEGYEVLTAADGEAARDRIADGPLDLVVLDLMLPRLDGLSVLRWLRKRSPALPVLIVSAKGREEEKVEGLVAGADDYLAKPFGLRELLARVEALLRRAGGSGESLQLGAVRLDLKLRKAFRGRKEVPLSRKEADILFYLARNRGRTVPRDEILDAVWGYTAESAARAVDFHVCHLRRKLERDPESPRHILTRHGVGYELVE